MRAKTLREAKKRTRDVCIIFRERRKVFRDLFFEKRKKRKRNIR